MRGLFLLLFFLLAPYIFAAPETFDHLADYKVLKPLRRGPKEETVKQGNTWARATYEYDQSNRLSRANFFQEELPDGTTLYHYGRWGLESEEVFDAKGTLVERLVYRYTKDGKLNGYSVLDSTGKEVVRWEFSLTGGMISSGRRYTGKELTESFQITSENGNQVQVLYNGLGEKQGEIVFYRQNNQLSERIKTDVTGKRKITYRYDEEGRLISMTFWVYERDQWFEVKKHLLNY